MTLHRIREIEDHAEWTLPAHQGRIREFDEFGGRLSKLLQEKLDCIWGRCQSLTQTFVITIWSEITWSKTVRSIDEGKDTIKIQPRQHHFQMTKSQPPDPRTVTQCQEIITESPCKHIKSSGRRVAVDDVVKSMEVAPLFKLVRGINACGPMQSKEYKSL